MQKRSILWNLSSKYATLLPNGAGQTSRFLVALKDLIVPKSNERVFVTCRYAEIPNSYHQISAAKGNNVFYLRLLPGVVTETLTIPDGTYTGPGLETAMNLAIQENAVVVAHLAGEALTVTYSSERNIFIFNNAVDSGDFILLFDRGGFADIIGFEAVDANDDIVEYDLFDNTILISVKGVDVIPNVTIALNTNVAINNIYSSRNNGRTSVLEYFTRGASGTRSTYSNSTTDVRGEVVNRQISDIELWLTDADNVPLQLNGLHWNVTLLFEIEEVPAEILTKA